MIKVVDAAVAKAYGGRRKIHWMEIYAGEKSTKVYGPDVWLPDESLEDPEGLRGVDQGAAHHAGRRRHPLAHVALRQELDLYVCLRPVRWFTGVPSPVKEPHKVDMVIFRENSEDIYAGIEWAAESDGARKVIDFLIKEMGVKKIRFPKTSASASSRCRARHRPPGAQGDPVRDRQRQAVGDARAQGQHHEVHRGRVPRLGYAIAEREFGAKLLDGGPWMSFRNPKTGKDVVVKDVIADAFLQQILLRPAEYSVIATLNLNGDYISDALAGRGGRHRHRAGGEPVGLGGDVRGDARHRAQVRGQGLRQPRLRDPVGRDDAGPHGLEGGGEPDHREPREGDRRQGRDYDFARLMQGAKQVSCSGFGQAMIERM